ncbi:MAG: hypothetical protein GQ526_01060 [Ardenticatenales bacterium]|nr:hypothetical protein [Ardenticatenales bacterium]
MPDITDCPHRAVVVLISANTEWQVIRRLFPAARPMTSPYGEWFGVDLEVGAGSEPILFFHGGWGKIAAAASTQYVIGRWSPRLLINLGTCGGIEGKVERGTIILAERTVVYDIIEQMGDPNEHLSHYAVDLDLSWLDDGCPPDEGIRVMRTLLVSADRDLLAEEIPHLKEQFGAVAGDWESGAIAWVADRNGTRCLILRGVTDLVGSHGGEAYGDMGLYVENTTQVMGSLVGWLPSWIARARSIP